MNIVGYGRVLRATIMHNLGVLRDGGGRESFLVPHAISEPGVGKTQVMREVADGLGNEGWELFAGRGATAASRWRYQDADFQTRDVADLGGNPWVLDGRSVRMRPDWLPHGPEGDMVLLAIDEIAQAPLANLNIAGTLLREGRIGEHALATGCMLAAASNPHGTRAGTNALPGQVKSRMIHYGILPDAIAWADYAVRRGLSPFVVAYNKRRKDEYHHKYDPAAVAYPCGRSWEMLDAALRLDLPTDELGEAMAGCVGEAAATDYRAFVEAARRMPDLDLVLRDPMRAPLPEGLDITFVTMQGLASRATAGNLDAIVDYLARLAEPEYGMGCMADALAREPALGLCAANARWEAGLANAMRQAA